jgi:hypothetical protein
MASSYVFSVSMNQISGGSAIITHESIKFRKVLYVCQSQQLCLILYYLCVKSVSATRSIMRYHHKNKQRKLVGKVYRITCEEWDSIPSQKVNNF